MLWCLPAHTSCCSTIIIDIDNNIISFSGWNLRPNTDWYSWVVIWITWKSFQKWNSKFSAWCRPKCPGLLTAIMHYNGFCFFSEIICNINIIQHNFKLETFLCDPDSSDPLFHCCAGIMVNRSNKSRRWQLATHRHLDRPYVLSVVLGLNHKTRHAYQLSAKSDNLRPIDDLTNFLRPFFQGDGQICSPNFFFSGVIEPKCTKFGLIGDPGVCFRFQICCSFETRATVKIRGGMG